MERGLSLISFEVTSSKSISFLFIAAYALGLDFTAPFLEIDKLIKILFSSSIVRISLRLSIHHLPFKITQQTDER